MGVLALTFVGVSCEQDTERNILEEQFRPVRCTANEPPGSILRQGMAGEAPQCATLKGQWPSLTLADSAPTPDFPNQLTPDRGQYLIELAPVRVRPRAEKTLPQRYFK